MNLEEMESRYYELMHNTLSSVYLNNNLKDRITGVLGTIGEFMEVSRVYVFEDDFERKVSKNTYEWCAPGIVPQIDELQEVPHEVMGPWHDMLRRDGIIAASKLRELPDDIYDQLVVQGILSIVVLPLCAEDRMFGYVGFDECSKYHTWTTKEIEMLRALTNLVSTLISRYNSEQKADAAYQMFRTVLDNIESPIYVSDMDTYKILFANKKFRESLGGHEMEGQVCWRTIRPGQNGPCADCPNEKLRKMGKNAVYTWETYNEKLCRWFYCTDSLVKWTDGRTVHLQTALDISDRKENEEKLKYSATYDAMTKIFNRENGLISFHRIIEDGARENYVSTFCLIDLDGLKQVNDTYGHNEGDRYITTIVSAIKSGIRPTDVFARMGGDEFLIVMRGCPLNEAQGVIKRIKKTLAKKQKLGKFLYELSFSEGLEEIKPDIKYEPDALIKQADDKMYSQKQAKKNKQ